MRDALLLDLIPINVIELHRSEIGRKVADHNLVRSFLHFQTLIIVSFEGIIFYYSYAK